MLFAAAGHPDDTAADDEESTALAPMGKRLARGMAVDELPSDAAGSSVALTRLQVQCKMLLQSRTDSMGAELARLRALLESGADGASGADAQAAAIAAGEGPVVRDAGRGGAACGAVGPVRVRSRSRSRERTDEWRGPDGWRGRDGGSGAGPSRLPMVPRWAGTAAPASVARAPATTVAVPAAAATSTATTTLQI